MDEPRFGEKLGSFLDERGIFARLWDKRLFSGDVVNFNGSVTLKKGSIRGLHLQRGKHSETKIIRVLFGEIYDVVINLNPLSESYGKVFSYFLNPQSPPLVIPKYFAHGFQSLSDGVVITYAVDQYYEAHSEVGVNPLSDTFRIPWPLVPTEISVKDRNLPAKIESDITRCVC